MVWILSHLKGNARNVLPHVADEAVLEERIADSGVLKVDTAVADSYKLSRRGDHLHQRDQWPDRGSGAAEGRRPDGGGPGGI